MFEKLNPQESPGSFVSAMFLLGALLGAGKALVVRSGFTIRLMIGRALVTGGLGASAGMLVLLLPQAHPVALLGMAAALSSLGLPALRLIFGKIVPNAAEGDRHE